MLLLIALFEIAFKLQAQQNRVSDNPFLIKAENLDTIKVNRTFSESATIRPFNNYSIIYGLAASGKIQLLNNNSLVRVIMVDASENEYLVCEFYPAIAHEKSFSLTNICEETAMLNGVIADKLKIELINATIDITNICVSITPFKFTEEQFYQKRQQIINVQNDEKINVINNKGLTWTAGNTGVSHIPYSEKKKLVILEDHILNLQGFEYYKAGNFVNNPGYKGIKRSSNTNKTSTLVNDWDWRNRHGANNPLSPYYNGSKGWLTSVKYQECNHCWAFGPTAALEGLINIYYNDDLNMDLSEQAAASCSGGSMPPDPCNGGSFTSVVDYIASTGLVDENCFPYTGTQDTCSHICINPTERFQADISIPWLNILESDTSAVINCKKAIINYGPVPCCVTNMGHVMCLVGFKEQNDITQWLFKNSWGTGWGDGGFGYITIDSGSYFQIDAFKVPLISLNTYPVRCRDEDGDGYYNWGIGPKPANCPNCPAQEDINDWDPTIGPDIINEFSYPFNILVFPNPTKDKITIFIPEKSTIEILNINGQIIKTIESDNKQTTIDLNNLSSGVYIVKVKTDKEIVTKKIIKE